jgi:1-acyl-sn-glycerol-3-phosphate acyltransferase
VLSLRNLYEALAVSGATLADSARGRLTDRECDARLEGLASHVVRNAEIIVSVRGREHLEGAQSALGGTDGPRPLAPTYVVMSNHQSYYDVPVLYYVLGGRMRFVAGSHLFAVPLLGRALRQAGMIPTRQERRRGELGCRQGRAHGGHPRLGSPRG